MEQFNPNIRIVAIDQHDVAIMFDSAMHADAARSPKVLRISRMFSELKITVDDFVSQPEVGDHKEYRGIINLVVTPQLDPNNEVKHVLAEPILWIKAESRHRKNGAYHFDFCSPEEVTRSVRNGVANALFHALAVFYAKEAKIDTVARAPTQQVESVGESRSMVEGEPVVFKRAITAKSTWFRKKTILTTLAGSLLVFGLFIWVGNVMAKRDDPLQGAVAKVMLENPSSAQAQIELTKETLKQMGLDPGKSNDIGCLTSQ